MKLSSFLAVFLGVMGGCLGQGSRWSVEPPVHAAAYTKCSADLIILTDLSGSICKDDPVHTCDGFEDMKRFLIDLVDTLIRDDNHRGDFRVAMVNFHSDADIYFDFYETDPMNRIRNLAYEPEQTTMLDRAFELVIHESHGRLSPRHGRSDISRVVLILTDGNPTEETRTMELAHQLQQDGFKMIAIGAGSDIQIDERILMQLSSEPRREGQNWFRKHSFRELEPIRMQIINETCRPIFTTTTTTTTTTMSPLCDVELVILLDESGSICDDRDVHSCFNWERTLDFLADFVGELGVSYHGTGFQVAMISFGEEARKEFDFNGVDHRLGWKINDVASLKQAILERKNKYQSYQRTNSHKAFSEMGHMMALSEYQNYPTATRKVVLFMTDAHFTNAPATLHEARDYKSNGYEIFAVGMTDKRNEMALREVSSHPMQLNKNYFLSTMDAWNHRDSLASDIKDRHCSFGAYDNPDPPAPCSSPMDVIFLVDNALGDCTREHACTKWDQVKTFVSDIIQSFDVGPSQTRVALTTFADHVTHQWSFDRHHDSSSLLNAVRYLAASSSYTSAPATALDSTHAIFDHARQGAKKVVIFITQSPPMNAYEAENLVPAGFRVKFAGVNLMPIGVGYQVNTLYLRVISAGGKTSGRDYYHAPTHHELTYIVHPLTGSSALQPPPGCAGGFPGYPEGYPGEPIVYK